MLKVNANNERIKRRFFSWLRNAEGNSESTINCIEKAILLYEEFTKYAHFSTYNSNKAEQFKKWLKNRTFRNNPISIATYHKYIKYLRKFFTWLSWQVGYKSKIATDEIAYLKIRSKEERIATQTTLRNYPSLEYVIKLVDSIQLRSEIDQRDIALISFALLSGMRDKAIATLPLSCFDEERLIIQQNPRKGVDTKFAKFISTTLFKFDDKLLNYVVEWVKHIKSKGFGSQDPIFPRSKREQGKNNLSFEPSNEVEPRYWKGTGRIREIFKRRSQEANLPYFPPHTFRHLAVDLAFKHCKNGEQIKAISQNFGHEFIATTLSSYANYTPDRLTEIINSIDFSKFTKKEKNKLEEIKKILLD